MIVDEEHEAAYKSDRTPRLQARDTAIRLGELARRGRRPRQRDAGGRQRRAGPRRGVSPGRPADAADRASRRRSRSSTSARSSRDGNRGLLSGRLAAALAALDAGRGDQAILVINRRGTASVVLCRDCGHVQACPDCDRPLVFHQAGGTLRCHHCGRAFPLASRCPNCHSARIKYLGGGTERVEREVRERFPGLRAGRLDRDVVERRGAAERVLDAFAAGQLDVLVGTSLVAKGLDVPNVTLVGVVSADVSLNLPDERAAERTYQLLAQAVGRAGRGERRGDRDHPVLPARAPGDPGRRRRRRGRVLRRRARAPAAVRVAAVRAAREADLRARGPGPPRRRRRGPWPTTSGGAPPSGAATPPSSAPRRRTSPAAPTAGAGTSSSAGATPSALLGGGLDAPWSVDVDPESLL